MEKEVVNYYTVKERIPEDMRKSNLFYYDLRHYDNNINKYCIERDKVIVNFYGTLVTDKEVLNGREYLNRDDFVKEKTAIRNKFLNPFRKKEHK